MKEQIKKHACKAILAILQVSFLGGGYVYVEEFKAIRNQIQKSEKNIVETLNKINDTGDKLANSVKKVQDTVKKAEKACKKLNF